MELLCSKRVCIKGKGQVSYLGLGHRSPSLSQTSSPTLNKMVSGPMSPASLVVFSRLRNMRLDNATQKQCRISDCRS